MQKHITLSVFNHNQEKQCDLYDSLTPSTGEAQDIKVTRELSGWKELSFSLPKMVNGEVNHRWDHLKNEYLIRYTKGTYVDFYIIHVPKGQHNGLKLDCQVTCNHLSSLLNRKNLYFEFDDNNGIGTIWYLLDQA